MPQAPSLDFLFLTKSPASSPSGPSETSLVGHGFLGQLHLLEPQAPRLFNGHKESPRCPFLQGWREMLYMAHS